jgi:hypothetical protein
MLTTPIVEGAYYEREDGQVHRAVWLPGACVFTIGQEAFASYYEDGSGYFHDTPRLTRRVYLVPTDPAEVVARLRQLAVTSYDQAGGGTQTADLLREGIDYAADLVAEKLGVEREQT